MQVGSLVQKSNPTASSTPRSLTGYIHHSMFSPSYLAFVVSGMQRYFLVRQRVPWKKLLFCLNFAVLVCNVGVMQSEAGSYSAVLRCRNGSGFSTFFFWGGEESHASDSQRETESREG